MTVCSIHNLTKIFHVERTGEEVCALEGIDLDIKRSEFIVLLGPSGCGKSTLLYIVGGLEKPTKGDISFKVNPSEGKRPTCTVFQEYALFPWRTVKDNVVFGPEVRGVKKARKDEIVHKFLELVDLVGFENRYPHELSGGMRQRVALARALANDPEVLLFDEPLAALDAQTRRVLQDELVSIWAKTKKTFVYVTHSLEEAVLLGDRIVLMTARPGRVKEVLEVSAKRPRVTTGAEEVKILEQLAQHLKSEVEKTMKRDREI